MSGDHELLELAARAAGINLWWDGDSPKELVHHWSGNPEDGGEERDYPWNPLADDGDALRLAVKLDIDIQFNRAEDEQTVQAIWPDPNDVYSGGTFTEPFAPNKLAATRRAITRAAAEIGRAM